MNIRYAVKLGQLWEPNDPRRFGIMVRVTRILDYASGEAVAASRIVCDANRHDRVQVQNTMTGKRTTIRRDQFTTGARGWTLFRDGGTR